MLLVPGAIVALIGAHLYLVTKLGTTAPPWLKAETSTPELREEADGVNQREKEEYLREYAILKAQGKPFFPYAVAKDAAMACVVMAVDHHDVARARRRARPEGQPDDDDLRAAARVVLLLPLRGAARDQAAGLVPLATIGVPTICMILLFLLPFYDRGPERRPERRPIATTGRHRRRSPRWPT